MNDEKEDKGGGFWPFAIGIVLGIWLGIIGTSIYRDTVQSNKIVAETDCMRLNTRGLESEAKWEDGRCIVKRGDHWEPSPW